jgi:hypothetical protein
MKKRILGFLVLFCNLLCLSLSSVAYSAPLNLTPSYPDFVLINGQSLNFVHDSVNGGGTLTISSTNGIAGYTEDPNVAALSNMTVQAAGPGSPTGTESFLLTATLDQLGNVISGSFKLDSKVWNNWAGGNIRYNGNTDPNGLLSGDLDLFGFNLFANTSGGIQGLLEFTFDNASGRIATDTPYGHFSWGGIIMHLDSSTLLNTSSLLTTNWTGSGHGDVFVPIPAAVWLFGSGFLALVGVARRKFW